MQKKLIAALVTGLILFIWQFLSFGLLQLHGSQMQYTENQDAVLQGLADAGLTEGQYFMPRAPMDATGDEQAALMEQQVGKPWAQVNYHESLETSQGLNMFRGFAVNFLAGLLLAWILLQFTALDMKKSVVASISVGLIGYLTINYLNSIWFQTSTLPDLVDAFVGWGLVGLWLGWYLPR